MLNSGNENLSIDGFDDVFDASVNLWRGYCHTEYAMQYFNLMKLIVSSTVQYFDKKYANKSMAIQYIAKAINKHNLNDKGEFLFSHSDDREIYKAELQNI